MSKLGTLVGRRIDMFQHKVNDLCWSMRVNEHNLALPAFMLFPGALIGVDTIWERYDRPKQALGRLNKKMTRVKFAGMGQENDSLLIARGSKQIYVLWVWLEAQSPDLLGAEGNNGDND